MPSPSAPILPVRNILKKKPIILVINPAAVNIMVPLITLLLIIVFKVILFIIYRDTFLKLYAAFISGILKEWDVK